MKKKLLTVALTLAVAACFLAAAGPAFAKAGADLSEAGLSETEASIEAQLTDPSLDPYDFIDEDMRAAEEAKQFPVKFDLRDVNGRNFVTPVKLQDPFGTCWAFAAAAAAETSILSNDKINQGLDPKTFNLSEKHLAWFTNNALDDPASSQNGEGTHHEEGAKITWAISEGGEKVLRMEDGKDDYHKTLIKVNSGVANLIVSVDGVGTMIRSVAVHPGFTKIRKMKAGKRKLTVTVKELKGQNVTGYQIQYRVKGKKAWKTKTISAKTTKAVLKKLKTGKRYEVRACAFSKGPHGTSYGFYTPKAVSKKIR